MCSKIDAVFMIIFVGLFSQINGLISLRYDVPVNITQQTLSLCPCSLGEDCNTTVIVPMMETSTSHEWYSVNSSAFKSSATRALQCGDQELHLTISEGSFALLATGELLHVHAKLVLDNSSFCLKRSYSEDYVFKGNLRVQQVMLEAEICMVSPSMSLCCPSGSVISSSSSSNTEPNITLSCVPSAVPSIVPPISFDGSTHTWPLEGQVRDFPTCPQTLSIVPVSVAQPGFGYLQLVENRLQFRWQPGATEKFLNVDSSKYCIGQERSYNSLRPVVAVCPSEHKPENYCKNSACFGKCCPDDQIYDLYSNRCVSSSFIFSWSPFREADAGYRVVYGMPSCESFFAISAVDTRDIISFLGNGSLHIESSAKTVSVPEYCFDIFQNHTLSEAMALVCFGANDDKGFKPHDYLEDQSVVLLVLSSVLLISAAHLLISMACYLCTVKKENTHNTSSTNREAQLCLGLNVFQLLVCVFIYFPAIQIILVALLQFFHQELNQYFCILIASVAEWAALCSSGYIVALWLQLGLRLRSPRLRLTVLLFVVPALLAATLVIVSVFVIEPERPQTCDINAAFADPWGVWLTTVAHGVLLLVAFAGLSLPLCWRRYARTSNAQGRQHRHLCCIGIGVQEENLEVKSNDDESRQENDVRRDTPTGHRLEKWWLLLKLDCLLLAAFLFLLAVWQQDAVAFWAFGDIVLAFKCNVMAACLWIYLCKHCKVN